MMQIVNRWKVTFYFSDKESIPFYIDENFYSNVLRKVADISFGKEKEVTNITIDLVKQ